MLVSWDWLKDYIGDTTLTAREAADLLGAHAFELEGVEETADDTIIDVDILPNRSSDCLCHRGVARELASITGVTLARDPLTIAPKFNQTDKIQVEIKNEVACPRFTAALVTGVEVKDSPQWLQKRLAAIEQRPINNIVDATNYVMYAIGQPLHAYDADLFAQVDGKWNFVVRDARPGETVSLLAEGGKNEDRIIDLTGSELLIVDGATDTPIGLAGVKGGRYAGVHAGTKNIIIEAAHFHPTITRKTARRLGIVIDASKRFENEPARELPPYAQTEIIKLITDIAGGECEGVIDDYRETKNNPEVVVTVSRVNALLGLSLTKATMKDILERIGASVTETENGFAAIGPWERTDLNIEEDFIEEIGRIHGYRDVQSILPEKRPLTEYNTRHYYSELVRQVLIAEGFSEVITSSFRNKDQVQLLNALASDKTCLRSTLSKNLAEALEKNAGFADLLGTNDTRIFEIGSVFSQGEKVVREHVSLALGVRIKQSGYTGKEDAILNAILAQLQAKLGVSIDWKVEKGVAETNFTTLLEQLPDPVQYDMVEVGDEIVYQPFSVYPAMTRDIAMWVEDASKAQEVEEVLRATSGPLLIRLTHVDTFTKDGRTSLAFRLVFQSKEKTLTDQEVNNVMDGVYTIVLAKGWEVR